MFIFFFLPPWFWINAEQIKKTRRKRALVISGTFFYTTDKRSFTITITIVVVVVVVLPFKAAVKI